jgi:hypothetical protein
MKADLSKVDPEHWKGLCREATVELIQKVVDDSDRLALQVILETRTLFRLSGNNEPLLLPQYLMKLRDRIVPGESVEVRQIDIADCAYDLTLAKYSNFPNKRGPDCRRYYRAFLSAMTKKRNEGKYRSKADEEDDAGRVLQKLINRNCLRSELECRRKLSFMKRYRWMTNGGEIELSYPSYLKTREFKCWLEERIGDNADPGERRRIQAIVDGEFPPVRHIPEGNPGELNQLSMDNQADSLETRDGMDFVRSLAEAVADETVANMNTVRSSIRNLGEATVRSLILRVFSRLASGEFKDGEVAREFGISKATFSRFAGRNWFNKQHVLAIPDLWRTTARVLSENEAFMERVVNSGLTRELDKILDMIDHEPKKGLKNGR